MDPTKSFDHLDPKLKETYARVMGTPTPAGNTAAPGYAPGQPAAAPAPTPPPNMNAGQNQFSQPSYGQPLATPMPNQNAAPNPGTGPTINTMPMGATSMFSQPAAAAAPDTQASVPANSSFFSNPSPAATEPSQPPAADTNLSAPFNPPATEPAPVPVTPYSPDATQAPAIPVAATAEQFAQPLPSPASVAQNAPKETSALLRVLYIIAAVVFFAIYTVFWIKVFNLPFLF